LLKDKSPAQNQKATEAKKLSTHREICTLKSSPDISTVIKRGNKMFGDLSGEMGNIDV